MKRFTKIYLGKEVTLVDGRKGTVVEIIDRYGGLAQLNINGSPYVAQFSEIVRKPNPTWKHGRSYYKDDYAGPTSAEEYLARLTNAMNAGVTYEYHYENPFVLQYLYYVEGMSLKQMADEFGCHPKTIGRWMNYFGLNRRTNSSAQFVAEHGVQEAFYFGKLRYNKLYGANYE